MVQDITINLLPGLADKERALRDRQKEVFLTGLFGLIDGIVIFVVLLLSFHNIALDNSLSLLNKKIDNVKSDIEEFAPLETTYNDLQRRITIIKDIKAKQHNWTTIINALAKATLKTTQINKYTITSSTIKINGVSKSSLELEKQKEALRQTAVMKDYTVKKQDTWKSIAKAFNINFQTFVALHGIDPTIEPTEGKILRIKKPIFTQVTITSLADVPVGQPVNFEFAVTLEKGVV